ncbi:MAG: hypothetical protein HC837_00305 [Chloroflexaceae bacterium]|nr:hypothetical protein [Chloroflexaceae bacterium]
MGLVFDPDRHPWIEPNQSRAAGIALVIQHCSTGAFQYVRKDGTSLEVGTAEPTVVIVANGPFSVQGKSQQHRSLQYYPLFITFFSS